MARENFTKWLEKQAERDDVVGDLARDAACDTHFPRDAEPQEVVRYVAGRSAGEVGRATLEAWVEWRGVERVPMSVGNHLAEAARSIAVLIEAAGMLLVDAKRPAATEKFLFATLDLKSKLHEAVMRAAVDGGDVAFEELHELADGLSAAGEDLRRALPERDDVE